MVIEKLKAEQNKNERINPEIKKIIRFPNLPERMIALVARQQYQQQPLFANMGNFNSSNEILLF